MEEGKKEEVKEEIAEEAKVNDIVAEAKKAAEEIRSALNERLKIIEREEKLISRKEALGALGGGSFAGGKPKVKEETAKEYANRVLSGKKI